MKAIASILVASAVLAAASCAHQPAAPSAEPAEEARPSQAPVEDPTEQAETKAKDEAASGPTAVKEQDVKLDPAATIVSGPADLPTEVPSPTVEASPTHEASPTPELSDAVVKQKEREIKYLEGLGFKNSEDAAAAGEEQTLPDEWNVLPPDGAKFIADKGYYSGALAEQFPDRAVSPEELKDMTLEEGQVYYDCSPGWPSQKEKVLTHIKITPKNSPNIYSITTANSQVVEKAIKESIQEKNKPLPQKDDLDAMVDEHQNEAKKFFMNAVPNFPWCDITKSKILNWKWTYRGSTGTYDFNAGWENE